MFKSRTQEQAIAEEEKSQQGRGSRKVCILEFPRVLPVH